MRYSAYFQTLATFDPHPWQVELGEDQFFGDRLLRIPTGFGKTFGVLVAWLYHRLERGDETWPRRLVWCLPMRVLVEQTEAEVRSALDRLGKLWDGQNAHEGKVGVHVLMGGADSGEWHLHPEHCSVLIGTQDMLLSRAMNRGYGAHRARWPWDFGLLNHDCLWVLDEVQLMDVGLATSGQLQAFRTACGDAGKQLRPCCSWWMSATMQQTWLQKSPEMNELGPRLPQSTIPENRRKGRLWDDVQKALRVQTVKDAAAIAKFAAQEHLEAGVDRQGPTLVVLNTVDAALEVYRSLEKDKRLAEVDKRLVHSRFRPSERRTWREEFLNRGACAPGTNRIVVATQVIEAGVDISAGILVTELAPWPSLVQRFGRAARWGGRSQLIVVDRQPKDDKAAAPYTKEELDAARSALSHLSDGAPLSLERFEESHPELLQALYPYAPKHLLLSHELDDLFDTTPDLSGADIDISRFIRSGEERDLQVFWQEIGDEAPGHRLRPSREALCSVPFLKAQEWLCDKGTKRLKPGVGAWVWNWLDGEWRRAERKDLYPGQTVLIDARVGGYDLVGGWVASSKAPVPPVAPVVPSPEESGDSAQDDEGLSAYAWQTIAVHGAQVGDEVRKLAEGVGSPLQSLLHLAGRWHDAGKAHGAFQNSISSSDRPARRDLAKAPDAAWLPVRKLYPDGQGGRRAGFRHELASTLGLFAVLLRHAPDHPALLGPWKELFAAVNGGNLGVASAMREPNSIEREVLSLSAEDFDLLAYLVCSHHGKVRVAWHASPADQQAIDDVIRIRGVREGDTLPALLLATADGQFEPLPESILTLTPAGVGLSPVTGRSWTDRVLSLIKRHSTFQLAYLEALLRAADARASRRPVADPLLEGNNTGHGLESGDPSVAGTITGGTAASRVGANPTERGAEHGLRGGASGPGAPKEGSRELVASTRFVKTTYGRITYAELADHLADRVIALEKRIVEGEFDERPIHEDLLLALQEAVCADLTPDLIGWRKVDVRVGTHTPPAFFEVPVQIHQYAADLAVQLENVRGDDELLLETLAFAEGRFLSIHPFADFNGRVTRLFLRVILGRLFLPNVVLLPRPEDEQVYFQALRAGDEMNWAPLKEVWRGRFSGGGTA